MYEGADVLLVVAWTVVGVVLYRVKVLNYMAARNIYDQVEESTKILVKQFHFYSHLASRDVATVL